MSYHKLVWFDCDEPGCREIFQFAYDSNESISDARARARAEGWYSNARQDSEFCPPHARRKGLS